MEDEVNDPPRSEGRKPALRPLAASTYLVRNWGRTLPLTLVIVLAVLLVAGIVAMINSIPYSIRTIYSYSKHTLAISPRGDADLTPRLIQDVRAQAPVPLDRIVLCRATGSQVRSIVGKWPFVMLGMNRDDMEYYLTRLGASRIEGRLPETGQPECVISEPVARNLGLQIGDPVQSPEIQESYSPFPVRVVGIARTDQWLMVGDIEYQRLNHFPPIDNVLAFATSRSDQSELDRWAVEHFKGERAQVFAFHILEEQTDEMFSILYQILNVVIGMLVLVITGMMGMLMNIYLSQRIVEFGLLQAIGYTKRQLLHRVFRETAAVLALGWGLGVAAGFGILHAVKAILMDPNAFALDTTDRLALIYTLPIPAAILLVALATIVFRFRRFDPVSVVERRLV
jgi:ABC-type lipoprotein release transport system permease subunit